MGSFMTSANKSLLTFVKHLMLFAMITLGVASTVAYADNLNLSKDTRSCLQCHDNKGLRKKLADGKSLSLYISTKAFTESMHRDNDCEDCHSNIDSSSHGKVKTKIKSKRDFAMGMRESCLTCHRKKVTEYEDSVHAALLNEGSKKAPACPDCHNPHTVRSVKIITPITSSPCAKCHVEIFKAYSLGVHGQERIAKGSEAPLCQGCHNAHNVKAASQGDGIKNACFSCHKDVVKQHKEWLPNTDRHFQAISCPVCHAPNAQRRVNLRLYDERTKLPMFEKLGVPQFDNRTDAADIQNLGLTERALHSLLKEFNQPDTKANTILDGRLEVRSGVEAHQISDKSKAMRECDLCHKDGAEPFQSVTLTIAGPDGRPLRHGIQKDVLNSLLTIDSVRGFYVIGSTRIKLLDILLVMVVVGALCVPLIHMAIRRMFKRVREKLLAEASARTFAETSQGGEDSASK